MEANIRTPVDTGFNLKDKEIKVHSYLNASLIYKSTSPHSPGLKPDGLTSYVKRLILSQHGDERLSFLHVYFLDSANLNFTHKNSKIFFTQRASSHINPVHTYSYILQYFTNFSDGILLLLKSSACVLNN